MHCHIIFSTKNRAPLITAVLQPRLYEYIGGIANAYECKLVAAGGVEDHVHLLVSLSREIAVADAVRLIKTNSCKWVHETFPDQKEFAWQNGYAAFGVSYSQVPTVREYFAGQEDHHKRRTFKEEFVDFLRRHDIEFDERYLWESEYAG